MGSGPPPAGAEAPGHLHGTLRPLPWLGKALDAGGDGRPVVLGGVVMHTPDIAALYEKISEGARVVLF
ncbi:Hypothetical protein AA314_00056 [Archangium gephyra]|uniref:Uncharacterized protein n=1 Tax=Archangium gephyra TaxID=48 RepID=A0AAC8PZR1_9BACT|nr:Hypothetical protein AA314_00056 [Archangium gephyra]